MKKFIAIGLVFSLVSCGGAEETEQTEDVLSEDVLTDSLETDTLVEIEEATATFEYFEDYAQFETKLELYEAFGEENIKDDIAWYAEGTVRRECSYLTNPDNGDYIKFVFEEENPEKLSFIEAHAHIYDEDFNSTGTQKINTKCGVFTGMTLNELRDWNEAEFEFSGFGWDYSGGIMAKEGSKINECPVGMNLDYDYTDEDQELYSSLLGDIIFKSDNENAVRAPIFIGALTYYLPSDD